MDHSDRKIQQAEVTVSTLPMLHLPCGYMELLFM